MALGRGETRKSLANNQSHQRTAVILDALKRLAITLIIWHISVLVFEPPRYILPSPVEVGLYFINHAPYILKHTSITTLEMALGLVVGTLAGILISVASFAIPRLGRALWPIVTISQALPVFAIAPLLVLWLGFGLASKVVMTSLIIFFPITSAFSDGIRRTDRDILDACALTTATNWQTLYYVRLPLALPGLATGLRVSGTLAPLGAIVGEWVGASGGLGFVMLQANARLQTPAVFSCLLILAFLSLFVRAIVEVAASSLIPWYIEERNGA